MTKVTEGITTSLDGYITGPNDGPGRGLDEGGERLHYWVFGGPWSYQEEPRGEATGRRQGVPRRGVCSHGGRRRGPQGQDHGPWLPVDLGRPDLQRGGSQVACNADQEPSHALASTAGDRGTGGNSQPVRRGGSSWPS
jgi:hypothetical protein